MNGPIFDWKPRDLNPAGGMRQLTGIKEELTDSTPENIFIETIGMPAIMNLMKPAGNYPCPTQPESYFDIFQVLFYYLLKPLLIMKSIQQITGGI